MTQTTPSPLTQSDLSCIDEFRRVRPTKADQRREPGLDLIAIWREDIEHSIRCREIPADRAEAIRAALGITAAVIADDLTDQDCEDIIATMRDARGYAESVEIEAAIEGDQPCAEWVRRLADRIGREAVLGYAERIHADLLARVRVVLS